MHAISQSTWRRSYGGYGIDNARSIKETSDPGYIVAGTTGSFGNGASDIYLFRIDAQGMPVWSHTYGGPGVEEGVACAEVDGGFVVAGSTSTGLNGGYDMLLIRTDANGDPIWERHYGGADWDLCRSMVVLPDGFLIGGISYRPSAPMGGAFVIRTDLDGEEIWSTIEEGPLLTECNSLYMSADEGFLVAGKAGTIDGNDDAYLAKFDPDGIEVWSTLVGGDSADRFNGVVEKADGTIVAIGSTRSEGDVLQILLAGYDTNGDPVWERLFGNTADAGGNAIAEAHDNGLVITGFNSLNFGDPDMIFTITDPEGYFVLGNNYGNGRPADGYAISPTSDGGYVVAGWVEDVGFGPRSCYIVKADSAGRTADLLVQSYFDETAIPSLAEALDPDGYVVTFENGALLRVRCNWVQHPALAQVFNANGALVASGQVRYPEAIIPIADIVQGIYLLVIDQGGIRTTTMRFAVVR